MENSWGKVLLHKLYRNDEKKFKMTLIEIVILMFPQDMKR